MATPVFFKFFPAVKIRKMLVGEPPQTRLLRAASEQVPLCNFGPSWPEVCTAFLRFLSPQSKALRGPLLPEVIAACRPCFLQSSSFNVTHLSSKPNEAYSGITYTIFTSVMPCCKRSFGVNVVTKKHKKRGWYSNNRIPPFPYCD